MNLWKSRLALQLLFSAATTLLVAVSLCTFGGDENGDISSSIHRHHSTREMPPPSQERRRRAKELTIIDANINATYAVVPKFTDNPFFETAGEGCYDAAERLGVHCWYVGPTEYDSTGALQVAFLKDLIQRSDVSGIAVSAVNATSLEPVFQLASQKNIPMVTWDSDAPGSLSYIGTDNYFFGRQLAKVLIQLEPNTPGQFAIVSSTDPNIVERERGVRDHLLEEGWQEVATSPTDLQANATLGVEQMFQYAQTYPELKAIIPVMGAPMRAPDDYWNDFVKAHPDVLLVVGDAMANQLELLDRQFCHGLVGQLPHSMGALSVETLVQMTTSNNHTTTPEFVGTNVLEHLLIPLVLPTHTVDHNLVGQLRYVGYTLFALVAAMAIGFAVWTLVHRNVRVVQVAQPKFLVMVALGVLIMSAAVLPMGFDGQYEVTEQAEAEDGPRGVAICMSPIWLLAIGFSITFSSLMSKIHRVTVLFERGARFSRVQANERDALLPLMVLLVANCTILTLWTVLDPLQYVRLDHDGMDGWDRPVSTYGTCQSDHAVAFIIPLCLVNGVVLLFANWAAYKARSINEEFAESKYVALAMASMLQAALSGIPILLVVGVQESPQAFYMVSVFMIFIMCSVILLMIFVPKMVLYQQFKDRPASMQRAYIAQSIRASTDGLRNPALTNSNVSRLSSFSMDGKSAPFQNQSFTARSPSDNIYSTRSQSFSKEGSGAFRQNSITARESGLSGKETSCEPVMEESTKSWTNRSADRVLNDGGSPLQESARMEENDNDDDPEQPQQQGTSAAIGSQLKVGEPEAPLASEQEQVEAVESAEAGSHGIVTGIESTSATETELVQCPNKLLDKGTTQKPTNSEVSVG